MMPGFRAKPIPVQTGVIPTGGLKQLLVGVAKSVTRSVQTGVIPTGGLKRAVPIPGDPRSVCSNRRNPDWGIETASRIAEIEADLRSNRRNPDWGIETLRLASGEPFSLRSNRRNPDWGIETTVERRRWQYLGIVQTGVIPTGGLKHVERPLSLPHTS